MKANKTLIELNISENYKEDVSEEVFNREFTLKLEIDISLKANLARLLSQTRDAFLNFAPHDNKASGLVPSNKFSTAELRTFPIFYAYNNTGDFSSLNEEILEYTGIGKNSMRDFLMQLKKTLK